MLGWPHFMWDASQEAPLQFFFVHRQLLRELEFIILFTYFFIPSFIHSFNVADVSDIFPRGGRQIPIWVKMDKWKLDQLLRLSIYLTIYRSFCLSVYLSVDRPTYLSFNRRPTGGAERPPLENSRCASGVALAGGKWSWHSRDVV